MEQGELITAEDFNNLKALVKNEINRRSNSKSVGSMSAYNGSSYEYSVTPASGKQVLKEHIQKITQPLDAVNGGSITPDENQASLVTYDTIKTAADLVLNLSQKSVTAGNRANTGCSASCTGLCYSGCYSSCSGCSGCGGCGGCTGCSGDCQGGCTATCGDGCTTACSGACNWACNAGVMLWRMVIKNGN